MASLPTESPIEQSPPILGSPACPDRPRYVDVYVRCTWCGERLSHLEAGAQYGDTVRVELPIDEHRCPIIGTGPRSSALRGAGHAS